MTDPNDPQISAQWREAADVIDRYEAQVGVRLPEIAPLLAGVSAANRLDVLAALLHVDQEYRWKRNQRRTVEEYLHEFPELRARNDLVAELQRDERELWKLAGKPVHRLEPTALPPQMDLRVETEIAAGSTAGSRVADEQEPAGERALPTRIGRYVIEGCLGRGAFGEVYRGRHPDVGHQVAIKVARTAALSAGFLHEAGNVAKLRHPHIVSLMEYGTLDDGRAYIVYPFIAGGTLAARIAGGNYTLGDAIRWTSSVAEGLGEAHRRRIYHRDIKPANILLDEDDGAQLIDFGLAQREGKFFIQDQDVRLGTAYYMSPEQAVGRSNWVGPAADVYSLGVVLYELLTGQLPFRETDVEELARQIEQRAPAAPRSLNPRIPVAVEAVCLRALAKDPAARYLTATDFAQALRRAAAPRKSRMPVWAMATTAATLGVIAIGLIVYGLSSRGYDGPPLHAMLPTVERIADGRLQEVRPARTLRVDDRIECFARLDRAAYLYVFLFRSDGQASCVWRPGPRPNRPGRLALDSVARCPVEGPFVVPPGRGALTVVVAGRWQPLDDAALKQLLETRFAWPKSPPAKLEQFPAVARPVPDKAPEHVHVRGSEDPAVFDIPFAFTQHMEQWFDAYYAVMIPWSDAVDGAAPAAAAGAPAATPEEAP